MEIKQEFASSISPIQNSKTRKSKGQNAPTKRRSDGALPEPNVTRLKPNVPQPHSSFLGSIEPINIDQDSTQNDLSTVFANTSQSQPSLLEPIIDIHEEDVAGSQSEVPINTIPVISNSPRTSPSPSPSEADSFDNDASNMIDGESVQSLFESRKFSRFFTIKKIIDGNMVADCKLCSNGFKHKEVHTSLKATSNFTRHLKVNRIAIYVIFSRINCLREIK